MSLTPVTIPGYRVVDLLYSSSRTEVYRGYRELDGTSIIIKILKNQYPTLQEIVQFRNQYVISKELDLPGVLKSYSLENYGNSLALILEDFGAISLSEYSNGKPLELGEFLQFAISIVRSLEALYQQKIIHKDIKPANLLINPNTKEVKLADFSIASLLPRETQEILNPNVLEGTLAYMSPEQTGRMNRGIDYRTDFYSLGVTFYELLTGQLPFNATDPLELVHCHIARIPIPPIVVNPVIPQMVNDMIMKLLAKTPEERYQSAFGIRYDLNICLQQWEAKGNILPFPLGERDLCDCFTIPEKLYGRENEIATLLNAFNRVSQGTAEIMLVAGYSGIGKSALVYEVHKPIVRQRGYFISGKFDQFKRDIPFASLIQAFQALMRQLLAESEARVQMWREKILKALGANGQIILEVIPEVELLIGKQPPVQELGATESQNRFYLVFQKFIQVFTSAEHPLVLFLDDLQWADLASLKLIELLASDPARQYFLLIGAYRDNEVSPLHPLLQTLEKVKEAGAEINKITIKPLLQHHVYQLVAETLGEAESEEEHNFLASGRTQPLADLLYQKTQGHPFFLTQLLKVLYSEKLLVYKVTSSINADPAATTGGWQWDIAEIQAVGIADCNVVELITRNIEKLPDSTQTILKFAACIGNSFNLEVLAVVNQESVAVTAAQLWPALQTGLILPLSKTYKIPLMLGSELGQDHAASLQDINVNYKFLHDRVQQAAYALIPEAEKQETHLKIGRLLLKNTPPEQRQENIFALVNQLNFGIGVRHLGLASIGAEQTGGGAPVPALEARATTGGLPLLAREERDELAELNLVAGQRAKAAAAYQAALNYLNVGLGLLDVESWKSNYDLTFNLHIKAVEAQYLNSNFAESQLLAEVVLNRVTTLLEQAKIYDLIVQSHIAQNQFNSAIELGLQVLEMLGVSLETAPPIGVAIEDLAKLPEMTDPHKLVAQQILKLLSNAAFIAKPQLHSSIIFTEVNLCIKYGNSPLAAIAYSDYALMLVGFIGDIDSGYRYGEVASKLLEKFDAKQFRSTVKEIFNAHVRPWKKHLKETIEPLQEAVNDGIETGELIFSGYAAIMSCVYRIFSGDSLKSVEEKSRQYLDWMVKLKLEYHICGQKIWQQGVLNLLGNSESPILLIGQAFDESMMLPIFKKSNNFTSIFFIYQLKGFLNYLFKEPAEALCCARLAEPYLTAVPGMIVVAQHNFYYSLALLSQYSSVSEEEPSGYLSQVAKNQEKMKNWADHAPMNFQHKYDLVEAEKARVLAQNYAAMELYDRAIAGAKEQGYIQEEALANELAAEFYFSANKTTIGKAYLIEAYYGYGNWGATAKIKYLESSYPLLLPKTSVKVSGSTIISLTPVSTTTTHSDFFDLTTVLKASQMIAGEVSLEQLLAKLLKLVIENAGAQSGFLILNRDEKMFVEAAGTLEPEQISVRQSTPVASSNLLPQSVINYVVRVREDVVLNHACHGGNFTSDPYITEYQVKSVLCTPILGQGKLIGLVYLENNLIAGAFNPTGLQIIKLLCSQAAISLENAQLYAMQKEYAQTLEQKVQERTQELKESEQKYRNLVETSQDMIFSTDEQGRFTFVNSAVKQIHGYEPEEMIGRPFTDFQSPEQIAKDLEVFQHILAGEPFFQYETIHLAKDGRRIHLLFNAIVLRDSEGNVMGITGTASDITERKQAEEALRESEARYRRIIETTYEGIWMLDANNKTNFVNSRMAQILGYPVKEMLDKYLWEFMDEDGRAIADANLERRRQGIEEAHDFKFCRKDGSTVWAIVSANPIFDRYERYVGSLAMVTDITDRKKVEAALKQAREAADAANKAKSEFLSKMSHELRTPLNAILGFTQVLSRDNTLKPQQQEHLGIISRAGEHLLTLINDVLEMSKIEAGKIALNPTSFDLYRLLSSLEEMLKLKAESKGLKLIFERAADVPNFVKTDESKLRQVLINLLGNAIKFTERGSVTLRVAIAEDTQKIADPEEPSNSQVTRDYTPLFFEIEDTGFGIASEEISSLFNAFVQTEAGRKSQEGTGLGLPISRQFVQLMGGEISVSSTLNQGTIFRFNIQISPGELSEIRTQQRSQRVRGLKSHQKAYRILVVEDKVDSRLLLMNVLSFVGFEVREAANGQEAVDIWSTWKPHLIWMDMQMPVMDGYQATKHIKAQEREMVKSGGVEHFTVIIALTASAFEEERALVLSAGCDDFVSKPFQEQVIFDKMADYLGVEYVYEQDTRSTPQQQAQPRELTSEDLSAIPPNWISQIHQAATELDDERTLELAEQIKEIHPHLAEAIADLTRQLRFDKIMALTQSFTE